MAKTWKPTVAGLLCIISGIIGVIPGIAFAVFIAFTGVGWLILIGAPLSILGTIAIVGGIYALRRRIWGLALAGSICALVSFVTTLGILGIIVLIAGLSDQPDIIPFGIGMHETIAIIWSMFHWHFIGFIVGSVILGILPIIFVAMGKREFA